MHPEKERLRKVLKQARMGLSLDEIKQKSLKIYGQIVKTEEFEKAELIHTYINFGNEVQTKEIIRTGLRQGKKFVFGDPRAQEIEHYLIEKEEDMNLVQNRHKFSNIREIDLVIMPIVGFDQELNRLGMGGGWYDKFLKRVDPETKKIGLAFECQKSEKIPTEKHDIKPNLIVTEGKSYEG